MQKIVVLRFFAVVIGCSVLFSGCNGGSTPVASAPLIGMWGATDTDAALELTATGGRLRVMSACGWGGPLNSAVILDRNKHFEVTGTYTSNVPSQDVRYSGTVSGDTITLNVVAPENQTRATYTLLHNHQPTPFSDVCPG